MLRHFFLVQRFMQILQQQLNQVLPGASLRPIRLPDCQGLRLYLLDEHYPMSALDNETAQRVMNTPLYWLFCWASGLVMAQQILAKPALVKDKVILDVGSGSGVVAIAAAMAGAKQVIACDSDPIAQRAIAINAQLNQLEIEIIGDYRDYQSKPELISLADVLYDRENLPLLEDLLNRAPIWLADSRVRNFSYPGLVWCESFAGETFPALGGFDEFSQVNIYRSI